jgi:hypothetical protein
MKPDSLAAGTVGVLNVGVGDTKLSFDPNNPVERIRAARIVRDMLRRGYALLIEVERDGVKRFERAIDFKEDVCEYVIADLDPVVTLKEDGDGQERNEGESSEATGTAAEAAPRKRGRPRKTVPAESTRAVAVARISGG